MKVTRTEKLLLPLLLLSIFGGIVYRIKMDDGLKRSGVYVIGKVTQSDFGGEGGWFNSITYRFRDSSYEFQFTGGTGKNKDSLVFLHLHEQKPKDVSIIDRLAVPECFNFDIHCNSSWKTIPKCP